MVGRNGGGKTTLLRIITGQEEPDAGRVARAGGLRVGCSTSAATCPAPPSATPSWPAYGERARVGRRRRGARGAGRARAAADRPGRPGRTAVRRRAAPGRAGRAAGRPIPTCWCWTSRPTTSTWRVWPGWPSTSRRAARRSSWSPTTAGSSTRSASRPGRSATARSARYDGGYAAYVLARAERVRQAAASEARRQNLLRKELAWLRRGPPARTSKPRFRIEAAHALIAGEPPARDTDSAAARSPPAGSARACTTSTDVTVAVGDRTLLDDVTWRLGPGDRVARGRRQRRRQDHAAAAAARPAAAGQRDGAGRPDRTSAATCPRTAPTCRSSCGCWRRSRRSAGPPTSAGSSCPPRSWPSCSASAPAGSGPRSPTCPAASGAGCSCSGC